MCVLLDFNGSTKLVFVSLFEEQSEKCLCDVDLNSYWILITGILLFQNIFV